jgi:hypothetical protein
MRTTIELPDELLSRAKSEAALSGQSLKNWFIEAIERRLQMPHKQRHRRPPPVIGDGTGPAVNLLTPEQRDEAMFGPVPGTST